MKRKALNSILVLSTIICTFIFLSCSDSEDEVFSEQTKIALRSAGNQLLLSNQDSTSLVLPVIELTRSKFELSFENSLTIEPSTLVSIMSSVFKKSKFPDSYLVEVLHCVNKEVAYSYNMSSEEERTIIPCAGRLLPLDCYIIQVKFVHKDVVNSLSKKTLFYMYVTSVLLLLGIYFYKKKRANHSHEHHETFVLGSYKFYPEQNKLVKAATEISLSNKECELLALFVAQPNQIIKRDELTKKVWEDNGVIVGRSLDTYISKLRKKLQDDNSIKLTNVHGVGYKLEIV